MVDAAKIALHVTPATPTPPGLPDVDSPIVDHFT